MARPFQIKIESPSYGKKLKGTIVKFYGFKEMPKGFSSRGGFKNGKHLLELLSNTFPKFELNFHLSQPSELQKSGKNALVRINLQDYRKFQQQQIQRDRSWKLKYTKEFLSKHFKKYFADSPTSVEYHKGLLSDVLNGIKPNQLSKEDIDAVSSFSSQLISAGLGESLKNVERSKQEIDSTVTQGLYSNLRNRLKHSHPEKYWQKYFHEHVLLLDDNYLKRLEHINLDLKLTLPDFLLITSDEYVDILEIKTPDAKLMSFDKSHDTWYWSTEINKAIAQTENYLERIRLNALQIQKHIKDHHGLDLRIVRPRGIIIAGQNSQITDKATADQFRVLRDSLKHVIVLTYDDILTRLLNRISALSSLNEAKKKKGTAKHD